MRKRERGTAAVFVLALASVSPAYGERRQGEFVRYQVDDFERGRSAVGYQLRESDRARPTELRFATPPRIRSGERVAVEGAGGAGGVFVVDGAGVLPGGTAAALPAPPSGDQRTAVLLLDFHDATNNCTLSAIEDLVFGSAGSVTSLYQESSFGRVSFSGEAFGPFLIDDYRSRDCDPFGWAYQANRQAAAAGVDLQAYSRFVYLIATNPNWSCGFGGISQLGVVPSESIVEGYGRCGYPQVHAHELGHALGMQHASTDPQDDGTIDDEYGDYSDVMSGSYEFFGHHNAPHKLEMAWITPDDAPLVTANTRVGIRPLEMPASAGSGSAALRVAKPGTDGAYFVSLRRALGMDTTLPAEFAGDVSIHTYGDFIDFHTALVRILGPSETFLGPDFAVSFLGSSPAGAFIEVAFSCDAFPPVIEPSAPSVVRPGARGTLAVNLRNDDTALCGVSALSATVTGPDGWMPPVSPSVVALAPKASAALELAFAVPPHTPDGNYAVEIQVTDPLSLAHTGRATAIVPVAACRAGCDTCGNGKLDVGEECDDGNDVDGDGCDTNCTTTRCGNGVVTTGESCDDGNTVSGDGCSADCSRECVTVATCDDGDPCNVETCEGGLCHYRERGDYEGAICVVGALTRGSLCGSVAVPRGLERLIAKTVPRVEGLLRRAEASSRPGRIARLLRTCLGRLNAIGARARKLVTRGKLNPVCGAVIEQKAARPQGILAGLQT